MTIKLKEFIEKTGISRNSIVGYARSRYDLGAGKVFSKENNHFHIDEEKFAHWIKTRKKGMKKVTYDSVKQSYDAYRFGSQPVKSIEISIRPEKMVKKEDEEIPSLEELEIQRKQIDALMAYREKQREEALLESRFLGLKEVIFKSSYTQGDKKEIIELLTELAKEQVARGITRSVLRPVLGKPDC